MTIIMTLPDVLTRYFESANCFQTVDACNCFTADAIVQDEKRNHVGKEAIRLWLEETSQEYHPKVTVAHADVRGENIRLNVMVSGEFPGSPIELEYQIKLRDGKICKLTIQ